MEKIVLGQGARKNEGKVKFELAESFAKLQQAQIFTKGSKKYAPNNWLQGMPWSKCYASALRHMEAWARGEDFDIDPNCPECQQSTKENWICTNHTGELHSALAAWNWNAITSYYKWYPQGDDRLHNIMPKPKIGLDIDDVICVWAKAWAKKFNLPVPKSWFFDGQINERFDELRQNNELDEFYLSLEPNICPDDIPFEPHCYVTSRPVDSSVSLQWLAKHGFPIRPVHTVGLGKSKVDVIKEAGCDWFVDDRYENYEELNRNGVCCFLFDAPHNERYNVGFKRIKSLKDLKI
jgi:5'(3')-deoxyribonucleotidase